MILKKIHTTLQGDKFSAIGITNRDGVKEYQVVEILKKNDSISINSAFTTFSFEEVISNTPKSRPVILAYSGLGVISKKVENVPNYKAKFLFNANLEDFYWFEVIKENHVFASVVRKKLIDEEVLAFEKHQISILDVSFGPFVIYSIYPLIKKATELCTPEFVLKFNENGIADFSKNENNNLIKDYEVGGEKIKIKDILPFSTLINYFYQNPQIVTDQNYLKENRKEFAFKKGFNILGMIALPSFLFALLISYLLLNHYQTKYLELEVALRKESIAYNKLVLLEKDRENKETILKESGLKDSNFLSYYISEITKKIPAEINLSRMEIFPAQNNFKQGERVTFTNNLIELEGSVFSNSAFTQWVKELNRIKWLGSLEIVDFKKVGNSNIFKIKLTLQFDV